MGSGWRAYPSRMPVRCLLITLAGALLLVPEAVDAQRGSAQDRARRAYEAGEVRSLADILSGIRGQVPGEMLDAEIEDRRGRRVYRLKMLDRGGRVRDVVVDGKSGRILDERGGRR